MTATLITEGLRFPEGPIWMSDGSIVLVEIEGQTLSRVSAAGEVSVIAELGGGPNGAALGPGGRCFVCNNGGFEWERRGDRTFPGNQPDDYEGGSIQAVDLDTGDFETLYTEVETPTGVHGLRGPNDLVFDEAGGFWFTDHGKNRARDRDRGGLYYAKADGSEIREMVYPLDAPNGVGLSPDGDRVYVAETLSGRVFYWELRGPGDIDPHPRSPHGGYFLYGAPGLQLFDSLAVDSGGNVCVATIAHGGITVISPDGNTVHHVATDDVLTTNVCFGGESLQTAFVTLSSTGRLVSLPWPRAGLPLAFAA